MSAAVLRFIGAATVLAFALAACGDDDPIAPIIPEDATVYVVHGIPGTDVGEDTDDLPVDVRLGTACVATNIAFGTISQAIAVEPGTYNVEVRAADATGCAGEVLLSLASVQLAKAANVSIVAHLNAGGTAAVLTRFDNDLSSAQGSRVVARHAAAFGPVDVWVGWDGGPHLEDLANGEEAATVVVPGTYSVMVAPAGAEGVLFGADVPIVGGLAVIAYAVGNPESDNFTVLTHQLRMD